jgi:hypothetical protein
LEAAVVVLKQVQDHLPLVLVEVWDTDQELELLEYLVKVIRVVQDLLH